MQSDQNTFTLIDLFAGCGGLSLGLEQAGFKPVYVNELNKDAMDSYLVNRIDDNPLLKKFNSNDIFDISKPSKIKKMLRELISDYSIKDEKFPIDLVSGGPPCQGFSGIGYRRSYSVEKTDIIGNHLYKEMAHFIKMVKPKMFLFENVKGLMSAKWTQDGEKGEIWKDVLNTFKTQTGQYFVQSISILSKDYGVPQNRPRVFIIGIHKSLKFKPDSSLKSEGLFPEALNEKPPNLEDLLSDLIDPNYRSNYSTKKYPNSAKNEIQKQFRRRKKSKLISKKNDLINEHDYSKHSEIVEKRFQMMIDQQVNMKLLPEGFRTKKFSQKLIKNST